MAFNKNLAQSYDLYLSNPENTSSCKGYKRARKMSQLNLRWLIKQVHRNEALIEEIASQTLYIDPRGTASFKLKREQ